MVEFESAQFLSMAVLGLRQHADPLGLGACWFACSTHPNISIQSKFHARLV